MLPFSYVNHGAKSQFGDYCDANLDGIASSCSTGETKENINRKGNTWTEFLRRTTSSSACVCREVEMSATPTCL
ncbi:hypothetical protein TSUD_46650 [Trifolium subterraneum]|nr:hypothetical protein TSUD_46650 [Trifolium subterraneum]